MAQYALPISDDHKTQWSEGVGDGDGDAFDELDEGHGPGRGSGSGPDAGTTYWTNTGGVGSTAAIRMNLSAVTDPGVHTGHIVRGHNRKHASAGRQIDISLRFDWSGGFILDVDYPNVDDVWTVRTFTLTEAKAADIGNYNTFRIWSYGTEVGGGGPRRPEESAMEFECPDAPGGGGFAHSQGIIVG